MGSRTFGKFRQRDSGQVCKDGLRAEALYVGAHQWHKPMSKGALSTLKGIRPNRVERVSGNREMEDETAN